MPWSTENTKVEMAEESKIQWTDNTWNPWVGCDKVSPGCDNCYMFRDQERFGHDPNVLRRTKEGTFNRPLVWHRNLTAGEKLRIFTCSWSDWFHKDADDWRADAWEIIRQTPNLIYQILTKRPNLIASRLPEDWGDGWDNVWLGVSAENQEWFDRRWRALDHVPAKTKFVSYEPSIGPVSVRQFLGQPGNGHVGVPDWVIVGGESGPGARFFDPAWAKVLIEESADLGFKVFVKQMGKLPVVQANMDWPEGTATERLSPLVPKRQVAKLKDKKGGDMAEWPESVRVREYPVELV